MLKRTQEVFRHPSSPMSHCPEGGLFASSAPTWRWDHAEGAGCWSQRRSIPVCRGSFSGQLLLGRMSNIPIRVCKSLTETAKALPEKVHSPFCFNELINRLHLCCLDTTKLIIMRIKHGAGRCIILTRSPSNLNLCYYVHVIAFLWVCSIYCVRVCVNLTRLKSL